MNELSHAQKRLWILDRMEPGSAVYNIPVALRLRGPLRETALRDALQRVAQRHESLRTTFGVEDGEPLSFVQPSMHVPLETIAVDSEETARDLLRDDAARPFDLERGPLLRAMLLRLTPEDCILYCNLHHIVGDDWSLGVLLRDLADAYAGRALPPLPIQYAQYAAWHNGQVARAETHRAYWRDKLAAPPLLDLPTEPRPAELTHSGARYATEIEASALDALRRRAGATVFQTLVALTKVLLHRWSGQEDIVVGAPYAGRDRAELESQIGFYVNTLALRDGVRGDETFATLLARVKQTCEEAYEHALVPFDVVVADAGAARDLSRSPLFDVAVVVEERGGPAIALPGVTAEPFDIGFATAKFDLTFYYSIVGDALQVVFNYNPDLFRADAIARMAGHLSQLAREVAREVPIGELEMLTSTEREELACFNDTAAAYPAESTLVDLFEEQAARTPDDIAVIGRETLTYRELDARANGVAAMLHDEGVRTGDRVALLLPPGEETIAAILGVLKSGAAYVPLDPEHPQERIGFMIRDSGAKVVLSNGAAGFSSPENSSGGLKPASPHDTAYIIYTSGSTGSPKGCAVTHRNVVRLLKNERFPFAFGERDVWVVAHSFCFDFSVWEIFGALLYGGRVIVPERDEVRDPHRFRALLARHGVTVLNQVPAAFVNLIAAESECDAHDLAVHTVIFGGDRLDPTHLRSWSCWYPRTRLVNMYGITETTVHVTYGLLRDDDVFGPAGRSPIGVPLPETTVHVLNPMRRQQPVGVTGELYVGGSGVCRGYLNRDALTRERFIDTEFGRLYRSGDLGRWLPDGTLEHRGRNDDQVQVRGFRIELREIEGALIAHPAVQRALVVAREGEGGVQELVAYVVGAVDVDALRAHLRKTLPEYMLPAHFVTLDAIPLTANNKIDRKALPAPGATASPLHAAPRDRIESVLTDVWKGVLHIEHAGIFDNYFHLGGDSIKVIRLLSAIRAELGVRLEVKDVFRYPTIAGLAEHIRGGVHRDDALDRAYAALDAQREELLANGPDDWEDAYPMTDIEQGMIFHNLLDAGGAVYHDQFVFEIPDDAFDLAALERAFALLVAKHPILRTSFHLERGCQAVHRTCEVHIPYEEAIGEGDAFLDAVMAEDRERPFDVTRPGLWRARVIRFDRHRYALLWIVHHAIIDGWSNATFFAELIDVYFRAKNEDVPALTPLRANYRDVVADQLRWRESQDAADFWRRELDGWEHMRLPFGKSADGPRGTRRRLVRRIDTRIGDALGALARAEGTTARDAYLAAFAVLLELTTGRGDLLFGIVTNHRPAIPDGDAIFGCFLNSTPFRMAMPFPRTPREVLRAVRAKLLDIKPFEALSMRRIAELHGATAPSPFFDVLFNFVDFHVLEPLERAGRVTGRTAYMYESTDTPFDLSVSGTFGEYNATFYWLDAIFDDDEIARLVAYYLRIVERFAFHTDEPLTNDDLLGPEREQLLIWSAATQAAALPSELRIPRGNTPAVAAVQILTYADLHARADNLAAQLWIEPEECVAIQVSRDERIVIAMLAILKAGGAYVPIDPEWPRQRVEFVLANTGCRFVITDDGVGTTGLERVALPRGNSPLAYVNYTSGSTGAPKGSLIEQRSVVRLVRDTNYIDIRPDDRILQSGSIAFDACTFEIWGALVNGACVVIPAKDVLLDAQRFARVLVEERITILFLTTSLFNQFAEADPSMFRGLRVLLTGAEKASPRHFDRVRDACPDLDLLHVYGPTENTTFSTFHRVGGPCGDGVPIGIPVARSTAYVVDRNLQLLPAGVPGELCTGGEGVARGYIGDPELTGRKFVDDPFVDGGRMYRTGDLARWLPSGAIQFLGRIDRQVKVRGFRVEPGEIEQQLLDVGEVAQAAVLVRETTVGTRDLVAYYSGAIDVASVRRQLASALPPYMIPAQLVRVEQMPIATTGKIDRKALESMEIAPRSAREAPRSENEALLARIWSEVLGRDAGIFDNYFQLGGDSIKAIQINSRLRRAGSRMDVRELFLHPTIAELAPKLAAATPPASQEPLTGEVPLAPAQQWFFREFRGPLHHFHQPVLLRANEPLDEPRLRDALQRLWEHHDLLRATFRDGRQFVADPKTPVALSREVDVAAFDLERGPLFQAALDGDELFLVAHHLVVDAVSWRVLLEDLERAYRGLPLPPKSNSFREWTSPECGDPSRRSPFDLVLNEGKRRLGSPHSKTYYGNARSIEGSAEVPSEPREALLTAIGRALKRWRGGDAHEIALEGHGRDAEQLDLSRTVGWFTSIQPFVLRVRGDDMHAQLAAIRDDLARVPRGIRPIPSPLPRIHVNYLGELRSTTASGLFTILPHTPAPAVSPELERPSDIDVVAVIDDGVLRLSVTYDQLQFERRLMERFVSSLEEELARLRFAAAAADDFDQILRSLG